MRVRALEATDRSRFAVMGPEPKLAWLTDVFEDVDAAWDAARDAAPNVSLTFPEAAVQPVTDEGKLGDPLPALLLAGPHVYGLRLRRDALQRLADLITAADPEAAP